MAGKNWFDEARKVAETVQPCLLEWIEIELIYEDEHTAMADGFLTASAITMEKKLGLPFSREQYELKRPDSKVVKGQLDSIGSVRLEQIPSGAYSIEFPDALGKRSRAKGEWD